MFYDRLLELCREHGISITKLSQEVGISVSLQTAWKRGTQPRLSTVKVIADYFNVSADYLLGETDDRTPKNPRTVSSISKEKYSNDTYSLVEDLETLHKRPDLRVLLSSSAKLDKEAIAAVIAIVERMNSEK